MLRLRTAAWAALLVCSTVQPLCAEPPQTPSAPAPAAAVPQPAIRRWLDVQTFVLYSRFRFVENSLHVTTARQLQYKNTFRARFNIDREKRYTINVGAFSGANFISTWNNYGVGIGGAATTYENVKQLYGSAVPLRGLELQYGGLYVTRGENDEITTYDEDGYIVGERVIVRRPKELYLDEVSFTRGMIGPYETPNLWDRWSGVTHPNYWQGLVGKRFGSIVAGSLDYTSQSGANTIRAAATLRFKPPAPVRTLKYEQYYRLTCRPAGGFALWAERQVTSHASLQAGYASIDDYFGPTDTVKVARDWNADRMQRGRRFFAVGTIPIYGPLSASLYITHALASSVSIPLHTRFDAIVSYDVLDTLRRAGVF
jgi:hypothetical protein